MTKSQTKRNGCWVEFVVKQRTKRKKIIGDSTAQAEMKTILTLETD